MFWTLLNVLELSQIKGSKEVIGAVGATTYLRPLLSVLISCTLFLPRISYLSTMMGLLGVAAARSVAVVHHGRL